MREDSYATILVLHTRNHRRGVKLVPAGQGSELAYQLKVVLQETDPVVWRRLIVPSSISLHRLHLILQDVMGWTNSHLYRFKIASKQYGEPDPDNEFYELPFINSRRVKLERLVSEKGSTFLYEYDFGDSWIHELELEDVVEHKPGRRMLVCLDGERACPPEDCGGTQGYAELLGILGNPEHEKYLDMMSWLGGKFFPAAFSVAKVNRSLKAHSL